MVQPSRSKRELDLQSKWQWEFSKVDVAVPCDLSAVSCISFSVPPRVGIVLGIILQTQIMIDTLLGRRTFFAVSFLSQYGPGKRVSLIHKCACGDDMWETSRCAVVQMEERYS